MKIFILLQFIGAVLIAPVFGSSPEFPFEYIVSKSPHFLVVSPSEKKNGGAVIKCYKIDKHAVIHSLWSIKGRYFYPSRIMLTTNPSLLVVFNQLCPPNSPSKEGLDLLSALEIFADGKLLKRFLVKDFISVGDLPDKVPLFLEIIDLKRAECGSATELRDMNMDYATHIPESIDPYAEVLCFRFDYSQKIAINLSDGKIIARWKLPIDESGHIENDPEK